MANEDVCIECGTPPRDHLKRQRCNPCYQRHLRNEKRRGAFVDLRTSGGALVERLLAKVAVDPDGCWIFGGCLSGNGYGNLRDGAQMVSAHRASYEIFVGPIPPGLVIDHLCRVRACVNPAHLEPVTSQANVRRSPETVATIWGDRIHCAHGHEFTPENTRHVPRHDNPDKTFRQCRTCRRIYAAALNARKRAS